MKRFIAVCCAAAWAVAGCFVTVEGQSVDVDHLEGTNQTVNTTPSMLCSNGAGTIVSVCVVNTSQVDCTVWHDSTNNPGYPVAGKGGHFCISEPLRVKGAWFGASDSNSAALTVLREHQ